MSKRNVAYIKPQEPAFLARLKQEVGYKEGPNVDTKREELPEFDSSESEGEDQPQVVVLNPGDLTAEEAATAKKEAEEAPANLDERVIFSKPERKIKNDPKENKRRLDKEEGPKEKKRAKKHLLSFAEDEDEES